MFSPRGRGALTGIALVLTAAALPAAAGARPRPAVEVEPSTGTARVVQRPDGVLAGPQEGSPAQVAEAWADDNAGLLGVTGADLGTLGDAATTTSPGGLSTVRFRQLADGIPFYANGLRVTLGRGNRVVAAGGAPVRAPETGDPVPRVGAGDAAAVLAAAAGTAAPSPVLAQADGPRRSTRFASGDVARLVWFQRPGGAVLAWSLSVTDPDAGAWHGVVDARTGALLERRSLTADVTADVYDNHPGAAFGGTRRTADVSAYVTSATVLDGPFARTWLDLDSDNRVDPGEDVVPGSYPETPYAPAGYGCASTARCSWDPGAAGSWADNKAAAANQAQFYVSAFHDHLAAAPIGFTAAEGAFAGSDRVHVNVDDGASTGPDADHSDNANMSTPPKGRPPLMQMYLFGVYRAGGTSVFRAVNGADDASVVYHEYTHGLTNRLVTDADGWGALSDGQSAAMGEGWSDWYAKDRLVRQFPGLDSAAADGEVDMGDYADNLPHAIRSEALDCPVDADPAACPGAPGAGARGYTFGDYGKVSGIGPEAHADGEIWAQTLWDLRDALGSDAAERLVTDGLRLTVPEPSFLDARDAVLAADAAAGGVHRDAIWEVFRRRGMGYRATTTGASDPHPVEDFTAPPPVTAPQGDPSGGGTGTPGGGTGPTPGAAAVPVATPAPTAAPARVAVADGVRSGRGGRASVFVTCRVACQVVARLVAPKAAARRLGVGQALARQSASLPGLGTQSTVVVTLPRAVRVAMRRHRLRRLPATLALTVTAGGRRTVRTLPVRLKR